MYQFKQEYYLIHQMLSVVILIYYGYLAVIKQVYKMLTHGI